MRAFDIAHVLASVLVFGVLALMFDSDAAVVAVGTLAAAAGAAIAGLICRWWPGLAAPGWKLWLAAWLFNPLVLAALGYVLSQYECLFGQVRGWGCMGLALVVLASPATLVGPTLAVIVHLIARRSRVVAG